MFACGREPPLRNGQPIDFRPKADSTQSTYLEPRRRRDAATLTRIGPPFWSIPENFLRPHESMYCLLG